MWGESFIFAAARSPALPVRLARPPPFDLPPPRSTRPPSPVRFGYLSPARPPPFDSVTSRQPALPRSTHERERRAGEASGRGERERRAGEASGRGERERRAGEASGSGRGERERRAGEASGRGERERRAGEASGRGERKGVSHSSIPESIKARKNNQWCRFSNPDLFNSPTLPRRRR